MKKIRYVCAQPALREYAWQVEVMIVNFLAKGIDPSLIDIVCCIPSELWQIRAIAKFKGIKSDIPDDFKKLKAAYPVNFYFYPDTRPNSGNHYVSSIRPNILKQHWEAHPELYLDAIFYHDNDILFTRNPLDWLTEEQINDDVNYGSNTYSYISPHYIKSKGHECFEDMCAIMQIDPSIVEANDKNSIGAQYLLKNVTYDFWDSVERDSEALYQTMWSKIHNEIIPYENRNYNAEMMKWRRENPSIPFPKKRYTENDALQIFCADMWALLWGLFRDGKEVRCLDSMNFAWATDDTRTKRVQDYNILHNAGAATEGMFNKRDKAYQTTFPYGLDLKLDFNKWSHFYYCWVRKTERQSALWKQGK